MCWYVGRKEPKAERELCELVLAAQHTIPTSVVTSNHCCIYSCFWGSAVWSGLCWVILLLISPGGICNHLAAQNGFDSPRWPYSLFLQSVLAVSQAMHLQRPASTSSHIGWVPKAARKRKRLNTQSFSQSLLMLHWLSH